MSCRTLHVLKPESGEVLWRFTPYSDAGEWIYSQPAIGAGRVFIGDRKGYFHCLDSVTGEHLWRRKTSQACNNQVNATALLVGSQIITANNDGAIVCYDAQSGKTIWRQRVDGAVLAGPMRIGSDVIVASTSLYTLDISTGSIRLKISFPGKSVAAFAIAQRSIIAHLGPDYRDRNSPLTSELVIIRGGREIVRRPFESITHLGTSKQTGLIYAAGHASLKVIDPTNGTVVASMRKSMAFPDLSDGHLYGLTREGNLFADLAPAQ